MDTQEATTTHYCKQPGCTNEARSPRGAYAYCDDHRSRARDQGGRAARPGDRTMEQKIRELARMARGVDRAKEKAAKLTREALAARTQAQEAEDRFAELAREVIGGSPQ